MDDLGREFRYIQSQKHNMDTSRLYLAHSSGRPHKSLCAGISSHVFERGGTRGSLVHIACQTEHTGRENHLPRNQGEKHGLPPFAIGVVNLRYLVLHFLCLVLFCVRVVRLCPRVKKNKNNMKKHKKTYLQKLQGTKTKKNELSIHARG